MLYTNVFISYAREDLSAAEDIYNYLIGNGYNPWLDTKKLRVGTNWDFEIKKALREADFVVLVLSSTSIRKRGYVQKEFKYALDHADKRLIDDIYILPILLDRCQVPETLSRFHWTSVDQDNFREEILSSLDFQKGKYLASLSPSQIGLNDFATISLDIGAKLKNLTYQCTLPLFSENLYFDSNFVNIFIQQKALHVISGYKDWINEIRDFLEERDMYSYVDINYNITMLSERFLSMSITYDSYIGGAHPNTYIDTLNFKFKPDRQIRLSDLLIYNDIKIFLKECINKYGIEDQKESLISYIEYIDEDNIDFNFDENNLELIFVNHLPRVIMALGFLTVPLSEVALRFAPNQE